MLCAPPLLGACIETLVASGVFLLHLACSIQLCWPASPSLTLGAKLCCSCSYLHFWWLQHLCFTSALHEVCCSSQASLPCLQILASIIAGIGFGGYDYPVDGFGNCQFCRLSYRWGCRRPLARCSLCTCSCGQLR